MPHLLKAVGISDIGRIRSRNEDAISVEPELGLVAVADGMGGHPAGDVASSLAVEEVTAAFRDRPSTEDDRLNLDKDVARGVGGRMMHAVQRANDRILSEADVDPERAGMGTTLTALTVSASTGAFVLGHVGDSRAYVFAEGVLRRLTRDHTWVQEMIDAGKLPSGDMKSHPLRHILSRALGIERPVDAEIIHGRGFPGDLFLLCTDGLVGMLSDDEIESFLADHSDADLEDIAHGLVAIANERGGADNITVGLLSIGSGADGP